jgi:hypothetical protein
MSNMAQPALDIRLVGHPVWRGRCGWQALLF